MSTPPEDSDILGYGPFETYSGGEGRGGNAEPLEDTPDWAHDVTGGVVIKTNTQTGNSIFTVTIEGISDVISIRLYSISVHGYPDRQCDLDNPSCSTNIYDVFRDEQTAAGNPHDYDILKDAIDVFGTPERLPHDLPGITTDSDPTPEPRAQWIIRPTKHDGGLFNKLNQQCKCDPANNIQSRKFYYTFKINYRGGNEYGIEFNVISPCTDCLQELKI